MPSWIVDIWGEQMHSRCICKWVSPKLCLAHNQWDMGHLSQTWSVKLKQKEFCPFPPLPGIETPLCIFRRTGQWNPTSSIWLLSVPPQKKQRTNSSGEGKVGGVNEQMTTQRSSVPCKQTVFLRGNYSTLVIRNGATIKREISEYRLYSVGSILLIIPCQSFLFTVCLCAPLRRRVRLLCRSAFINLVVI